MHWHLLVPHLLAEPVGTLARYYCSVFEPKLKSTREKTRYRVALKAMLQWHGRPIDLEIADPKLLRAFLVAEHERGMSDAQRNDERSHISRIINDWRPGQIPHARQHDFPDAEKGTLEHYVKTVFARGKSIHQQTKLVAVMVHLHDFGDRRGIPIDEFATERCIAFLRWCLEHGVSRASVNTVFRYTLTSISKQLAAAKVIPRRIYLEPVAPLKKRRPGSGKASTNGLASETTIEWSQVLSPDEWRKVFDISQFRTVRLRVDRGEIRGKCISRKRWAFAVEDLSERERQRLTAL